MTGTRLLLDRKSDPELHLLYSVLLHSVGPGHHLTMLSVVADESALNSKLETVDGQLVQGSTPIIEYLMRLLQTGDHGHSPKNLFGSSELEYAEVHQWLSYCGLTVKPAVKNDDKSQCKSFAKFLNEHLALKTYMVGNTLTLADLVLYANIHPYMVKTTDKLRGDLNNFTRWFDLIQHMAHSHIPSDKFVEYPLIPIDLDYKPATDSVVTSPVTTSKTETLKIKKEDGTANSVPALNGEKITKKAKDSSESSGPAKKEKKLKEKQTEPAVTELPVHNPVRLDIRIGKIVDVKQHENADSLYVEQIDLGEAQPRTVVSGLVKHIPIDKMLNSMVVVLCNLKPAAMRGVKSEGMVLCATSQDGKVELLVPPADSQPGDKVFFTGFTDGIPDPVLNPKKKVWETIQPGLFTNDSLVACYTVAVVEGDQSVYEMQTAKGLIKSSTAVKAAIK